MGLGGRVGGWGVGPGVGPGGVEGGAFWAGWIQASDGAPSQRAGLECLRMEGK
jgi:hypothetical protein